jgi:glycosyltransferase involved in cell wall biosynthesis
MPSQAEPLRILAVTHNYPRFPGDPAGAFVARIAEGTAAQGHEVEVVAPHAPGAATDERVQGIRVQRFRYAPDPFERVAYTGSLHQGTLFSPLAALAFPGFLLAFGRAVRAAVRRFKPDIIHAHWWVPGGWFARRWGVPYVITCHGSDVRLLERGDLVRKAAGGVFRRAACVTTVSNFLARDIARLLPGVDANIVVTPMPVDVASFLEGNRVDKAEPPRILYAGNLVRSKGVDVLLQAAAKLTRRQVRYQLKLLAEGAEQVELQAQARALGIDRQVTWSRFVTQAEMPAEYGASTVTVLPTRGTAEGLGLTLVEALLSGSAVVGTPAGGIPEVILHEQTGLIARDGDSADLASQIQRFLTEPSLRDRLTVAGRDRVLRIYSPDVAIGRFLEIYESISRDQPHR